MRKVLVLMLVLAFLLSGCATVCTKLSQADTDKARATLAQIQTYYPTIQGLLPLVPYAGPTLQVAIPLVMNLTDSTLAALGKMLAENCADQTTLTLAQGTLKQIEVLLAKPEVQQEVQQEVKAAQIKRLKAIGR